MTGSAARFVHLGGARRQRRSWLALLGAIAVAASAAGCQARPEAGERRSAPPLPPAGSAQPASAPAPASTSASTAPGAGAGAPTWSYADVVSRVAPAVVTMGA